MQAARRSSSQLTGVCSQFTRLVTTVVTNETTYLKSWHDIPGPSSLPVIGQLLHFLPGGYLYDLNEPLATALYKKYGPIVKLDGFFGSKPIVFTFDAEVAATVLRSENWLPIREGFESLDYYRKVYSKNENDPDAPNGLISDHGEVWKKFRSTVNPIMLQPKTIKLYATSLQEVADDMIKRMRLIRNEKNMLEGKFDVEMNLWALESIGVVALGGRINCLDPNLPEDSPARKLIKVVHDVFKIANDLDLKPSLWRHLSTPTFKRAMQTYEDQMTLSKYFIDKAVHQFKAKDNTANEEKGVLEKLLEINKNVAIIMASDMLFAGIDTAANTMIATLYLLATNPKKQELLREEIMSQQDKRLYLKACFKESMRMMPIVMGSIRQTSKEYNMLGYNIPKDTQIIFGHQVLSMLEEQYPRASEYIPERWIVDKNDPMYYGNADPFSYSPFGFGVRSCIGRRIAELEMETFLTKIIENFEVEWIGPPLKTKCFAINYAVAPFNFVFKDRK